MILRNLGTFVLLPAALAALIACGDDPERQTTENTPGTSASGAGAASSAPSAAGSLRTDGAPSDDPALAARVKAALVGDPETTAKQITVQAVDGEITLSGFVDSMAEKTAAARVARSVENVDRINNNLTVGHTDDEVGDGALAVRVKAALINDPVTSGRQINVDALQGVVQLSGFVDSIDEKRKAAELAGAIKGVKSVENKLEVTPKDKADTRPR